MNNFFTQRIGEVDLKSLLFKAIEKNQDVFNDQNTIQLDKGLDSFGNDLGEYANFNYKDRWRPVDLNLTGKFRRSIYAKPFEDRIEMEASDSKAERLAQWYGDGIVRLS